jgi:predicted acyltransferase
MPRSVSPSQALPSTSATLESVRLLSVDALRGFDMFWILGGDLILRSLRKIWDTPFTRFLATQMDHCEWAGFHFYDLIFPLFVFIVGVSLIFSVTRQKERQGLNATLRRIVIRSFVLFLLGIFYMGGVASGFHNVYLAGVLHRIAVAYFFAALLFCFLRPRTLVVICVALLVGYWALMQFVPVPDTGSVPDLSMPGHNLAHYLDVRFLPGQKFEGTLLSTMAAVANCLLGTFAGLLLRDPLIPPNKKVMWLAAAGTLSIVAGIAWSHDFPIIKLLWTSSYVLVSCGIGAVLLASFYQIIEIWKFQAWARPFVWIGMNAITVYVVANIVGFHKLALRFVGGDVRAWLGVYADLAQAILGTTFAILFVYFLFRRRVFLRL